MNSKNQLQPEIPISPQILKGAHDWLTQYATDSGVDLSNLISQLSTPPDNLDENSAPREKISDKSPIRLARMGWTEEAPTTEETQEARSVIEGIRKIARFGYQIPAYVLNSSGDGSFTGIVTTGIQQQIREIWSFLEDLDEKWGEDIQTLIPDYGNFDFLKSLKSTGDTKLKGSLYRLSSQRIELFTGIMKDLNGDTVVLGVPAIDVAQGRYGYPPFTEGWDRPVKALQFIQFQSLQDRKNFENQLTNSPQPLTLLNNIYAVLFSPDLCHDLVSVNLSKAPEHIMKNGVPIGWDSNLEIALKDLAGLGFHYGRSEVQGGNDKIFIH